tara:strand:+ start:1876 stop:2697 length:822 start_codon:yes stop_codon:yes gene_type:complete
MESIDGPFGLQFLKIESCQVYLGTNKGGWVYASERPMHRVELPSFMIMKDPISEKQFAEILGKKNDSDELKDMVTNDDVQLICETLSSHFEDEVRRPTQSEWKACEELLNLPCGWTELLSDEATGNHRGANLDGRPRAGEMIGPLSGHRVSQSAHPTKENVYFCVNTPGDRPLPKVGFRLVVSPKREGEAPRVPDNANLITNVKSELFWTTILGIIPSFTIPILRGFESYAIDGWANLLFGGLCAGFVTGAFWRPRRPIWGLSEDGEVIHLKD